VTLLQPWGAVVAGFAGLGVLTLLYVLKLRRKSLRVGSTLLWEQTLAEVEVNTPWRRLRIDGLFVLQALAVACLALAVGRPAIGIGSLKQRVVVVIDASASMGATDAQSGRTRLAEAKRLAVELIENLRRARGLDAAVVALAGEATVVRGFTGEATAVLEGIDAVTQTDEPGDLDAALETIRTLTAAADGSSEAPGGAAVAYVFSDGGFGGSPLAAAGTASVRLVRVGPDPDKPAENIGVVAITAQRDEADPATVRVVARFISTFASPRDVSVRVLLDEEPLGSSTLRLPPAAEQTFVLPVQTRKEGVLTLRVLNEDALAADNAARVVIDGARNTSVVVVGPGPAGSEADPLVVNFAQSVSPPPASRTVGTETLSSNPQDWAGVDLVVFDRVEPRAGALPPVASVTLGAGLAVAGVSLKAAPAGAATAERVVSWSRDHPLMRDVALDGLVLQRPATLSLPPQAVRLAEGVRGPMIGLVEGTDGISRVVCAIGAEQGGWGSDLSFVVFMGNVVDYLTLRGQTKAGRQITTGQSLSARVAVDRAEVLITGPDGVERPVPVLTQATAGTGTRVVSLGRASHAGVYKVTGTAVGPETFAVNLASARESSLATADALPIRGSAGGGSGAGVQRGLPREVWDWFVIAALGLLGVEWLLYASRAGR